MRSFRLLKADEIECRVQQAKEGGVILLLYKTARTDAQLLDETFGIYNWQCDYKLIDGTLYCGIGIRENGSNEWVWKWNCGTESQTEAEKGRASDSLKRAGFVLGLGAELYSAPFIYVPASKCNIVKDGNRYVCRDDFVVTHIAYDEQQRISELQISVKGNEVWSKMKTRPQEEPVLCENCKKPIVAYKSGTKTVYPAAHIKRSKEVFGKVLCIECIEKDAGTNP